MKKRKKLKKKYVRYLALIFIIGLIIGGFVIYRNYSNNDMSQDEKNKQVNKDDDITLRLKRLSYSTDDIRFVKNEVNNENIDYLIKKEIDSNLAMEIIRENYYIDDYLEKYLNYYEDNKELSKKEIVTRVNSHLDTEFYTNTEKTDDTLGKFVILNKHYYSDGNYEGKDLVDVDSKYHIWGYEFKLSKECYEAFLKMYEDAMNAGYAFKINSAYRSYDTQVKIYQGWVNQDGQALADTYSARAGYSEHQTGYAFDVRDYPFTTDDYSKTKSFTWVSENAYKYGFIIRFPLNKEYITGYQYEPWHYRYVGLEAAKYIHDNDITFEEYYEYFIRFNNPRNLG